MRLSNRNLLAVTIGALGAIWCLAVFLIAGPPFYRYSGALTFVLIAAALAILYLTVLRRSPGRQAPEAGAPSVYFTIIYVAAALFFNTVFVLVGCGDFNRFLLLCNAVINVVYILLALYTEQENQRISDQLARTAQKLSGPANISAKLGEMLGVVEDSEIRKQILALKEAVDYSTNISTAATLEKEKLMEQQLDELMCLIMRKGERSAIQGKIREAEITWKTRSSASSFRG